MVKFLVNNAETLSKQEKEGSQKKETTGGGGDSQEGATSEFKKVLDVEKTSEQNEPAQEEVKSLVFVEPELPPIDTPLLPPLGDGGPNIENIVKPGVKMVLNWLRYQPQDLTYDKLSQDTCCSSQDTCCSSQDSCSSYESLNGYWGDSDESWDSDDDNSY